MGMSVGSEGGDDDVMSAINTTPLVDVMLVLLIIFLITIPVTIQSAPVVLPKVNNVVTTTKPENINLSVDADGNVYWNDAQLGDTTQLYDRLVEISTKAVNSGAKELPEIHIRGDVNARYEYIGRVVVTAQRAGFVKVGFITEPDLPGAQ